MLIRNSTQYFRFLTLTPTSYTAPESVAVGGGGGSGVGKGAPLRYVYTARGYGSFGSWSPSGYEYTLLQLYLGSNPNSRLEVVSSLNTVNIGTHMYHYNNQNCTSNYYPRVYIGTPITSARRWNYDRQNGTFTDQKYPANQWPQSYQASSQKGERIIKASLIGHIYSMLMLTNITHPNLRLQY